MSNRNFILHDDQFFCIQILGNLIWDTLQKSSVTFYLYLYIYIHYIEKTLHGLILHTLLIVYQRKQNLQYQIKYANCVFAWQAAHRLLQHRQCSCYRWVEQERWLQPSLFVVGPYQLFGISCASAALGTVRWAWSRSRDCYQRRWDAPSYGMLQGWSPCHLA